MEDSRKSDLFWVPPSPEVNIVYKQLVFIEKQVITYVTRSEVKFRRILKCFCEDIPAISAHLSEINRKTVHRIFTPLRERIADMAFDESKPFVVVSEVDESYSQANSWQTRARSAQADGPSIPDARRFFGFSCEERVPFISYQPKQLAEVEVTQV
jgi:hypothetical protein